MTRYLQTEEVLALHHLLIKQYGGEDGVRDLGLIDSAVNRPRAALVGQEIYSDLSTKAAVLFFSLVKNHGFVDGNKRIGLAACIVFLRLNQHQLNVANKEAVKAALHIANDDITEAELAYWISKHLEESNDS